MEALGYLAFSAVLYLTLKFFRIIFREYIFNKELYAPSASERSAVSDENGPARSFDLLSEQAC